MQPMQSIFFDPTVLVTALFLSLLVNRIVAYFATPIFESRKWNKKWLMYVSAFVGLLLSWFARLNLLPGLFPDPVVGILVTAFIVGGGANLIHDIIDGLGGAFGGTLLTGDVSLEKGAVQTQEISLGAPAEGKLAADYLERLTVPPRLPTTIQTDQPSSTEDTL
jgi:hypothetical protein